uniref:Fibronectin type-III domain-containing protein n=1 Tax=Macrostomum lignano TaxID=282301 RepID=A0A1I8ICB0_9PLAT
LLAGGPGPVRLEEPRPGHRYQFRAAAVSPDGSRGFGKPSEPLTLLPLQSTRPPAVRLSGGRASFDESTAAGWASVAVWWSLINGSVGDTEYGFQVSWAKAAAGVDEPSAANSAVKISQSLPGTARSYQIEQLDPDSLYHIEVRSLTASGISGPPSRISVSTARQPPPATSWLQDRAGGSSSKSSDNGGCPPDDDKSYQTYTPRTSFADNADGVVATVGLLTAGSGQPIFLLEWRRRVCIGARGVGASAALSGAILTTAQ